MFENISAILLESILHLLVRCIWKFYSEIDLTENVEFSSIEYHTIALIVPAILGIVQYFMSGGYVPYFCAFYVIWMTVSGIDSGRRVIN